MDNLDIQSRINEGAHSLASLAVRGFGAVTGVAAGLLPQAKSPTVEGVTVSGVRVGSAVVVVDDEGRILLGRRGKTPNIGRWVLPGGKVESFEPIDVAGQREVLEETGLEVDIVKRLGVFEIINPPDEHRLIVFSLATPRSGKIAAESDLTEVAFFNRSELRDLDLTEITVEVLGAAGFASEPAGLVPA